METEYRSKKNRKSIAFYGKTESGEYNYGIWSYNCIWSCGLADCAKQVGGKADIELAGSYKKKEKGDFKEVYVRIVQEESGENILFQAETDETKKVPGKSEWKTFRQDSL